MTQLSKVLAADLTVMLAAALSMDEGFRFTSLVYKSRAARKAAERLLEHLMADPEVAEILGKVPDS